MDRKQTSLKVTPAQVTELRSLIAATGLLEQIEVELYRQWRTGQGWDAVAAQLELLETAKTVLGRMGETDG